MQARHHWCGCMRAGGCFLLSMEGLDCVGEGLWRRHPKRNQSVLWPGPGAFLWGHTHTHISWRGLRIIRSPYFCMYDDAGLITPQEVSFMKHPSLTSSLRLLTFATLVRSAEVKTTPGTRCYPCECSSKCSILKISPRANNLLTRSGSRRDLGNLVMCRPTHYYWTNQGD